MSASPSIRTRPPSLYRAGLWHVGLWIVRYVPAGFLKWLFRAISRIYLIVRKERVDIVTQNLRPVLNGDPLAARQAACRVHLRFAEKLVDLWRVESGLPVKKWLTNGQQLETIQNAAKRGKGVLFITLHLGNWEHGGLLLAQLGLPLTVLTLAEPDDGLTELRVSLRRRCGVETLMIGQDSFAFVEVIKRLQEGGALAISLDRPPERNGVEIEFFGQPFLASPAAAELARASGCALIGVTIARRAEGFSVNVLPEITYDRRALATRDGRRDLTQQILRAFEPLIRQDIEQWYQFVPIWPPTVIASQN